MSEPIGPEELAVPAETAEGTELVETSFEGALALVQDDFGLAEAQALQDESAFLPYMRLIQGDNNKYKDPPFEFADGTFSLHPNKNDAIDLGQEIDIMFIAWRPLAMNFNEAKPRGTTDRHSEEFKDWRARAEDRNPDVKRGFQWGYEALVWLPEQGAFATFWLNNPSLRRFGRFEMIGTKTKAPLLRKKLSITSERIIDEQAEVTYRYRVLRYTILETSFSLTPDVTEMQEVLDRFKQGRVVQADEGDSVVEDDSGADETVR